MRGGGAPGARGPMPGGQQAGAPGAGANFAGQLAMASKEQRKNMIGEKLYTQIQRTHASLAGKITGMLLEGMEDSELLHLLETQSELDSRISEAIDVLEQHKAQA